jgi:hypothetical protein
LATGEVSIILDWPLRSFHPSLLLITEPDSKIRNTVSFPVESEPVCLKIPVKLARF